MDLMTDVAQQYEVEVKTLLGSDQAAAGFVQALKEADPHLAVTRESQQLNHYFNEAGNPEQLLVALRGVLSAADHDQLTHILKTYPKFALRTRLQNDTVLLVVKAAKEAGHDDQHALNRVEGEYQAMTKTIDELDELIRSAGYDFLSKWSRDRTEYKYKDYTVSLDKNAGYGYLAEIEKLVTDEQAASEAKAAVLAELASLGYAELSQERLGRMFAYYNEHWPEYYRTDKTFTVD